MLDGNNISAWSCVCYTNFLLTEREGRSGEYRHEVRTKTPKGQYSQYFQPKIDGK